MGFVTPLNPWFCVLNHILKSKFNHHRNLSFSMFSSIHELQSHLLVCSVTYMNYSVNKLHVLCICDVKSQIFILHLVVRSAMIGYWPQICKQQSISLIDVSTGTEFNSI